MLNRTALLLPAALLAAGLSAQIPASPKLIKWMSMEEAQAAAKKSPRPLFVDVYTSWCGPCKMLDARTFTG